MLVLMHCRLGSNSCCWVQGAVVTAIGSSAATPSGIAARLPPPLRTLHPGLGRRHVNRSHASRRPVVVRAVVVGRSVVV